ncbi:MAG: 50S ribosomal protein L10 [Candidatus Omnitrophica bacterium]|nr:50S ribosomal protein L10 [Candidatus Omnitrophota bacterium]
MAHVEKKYIVKQVSECLKNASGLMVANFNKLKVVDIDSLRRKLEKKSTRLIVTKNAFLKKALADVSYAGLTKFIEGTTGLAVYKDDPVGVAKTLFEFSKNHVTFKVRGGMVEGELIDEARARELSALPSKEVLLATVVMRMKSPITGLVNVLSGPIRGLVNVLNQISENKEKTQ